METIDGIILAEGMRVRGNITYFRSYMRTGDKEIIGVLESHEKHGMVVRSEKEPEKIYPMFKFPTFRDKICLYPVQSPDPQ